jgi:hypothetical protein
MYSTKLIDPQDNFYTFPRTLGGSVQDGWLCLLG